MFYKSTRDSKVNVQSANAIVQGISEEGGLFVPASIPKITLEDIKSLENLEYSSRADFVFSKFLTDFTAEEIKHCVESAYNAKKFATKNIAEIAHLKEGVYMLELWHGPTCAFKDMALQILPFLLTTSAKKIKCDKDIVILVATSGDTGKAALEGFKDVDGTKIMVFYPEDGVSQVQKKQMTTQEGKNVGICAIKGNFDDAQNGVKAIFTDKAMKNTFDENNMMLSSANSINWGRLAPQIIYYISTYAELVKNEEIALGEKVNVVVPTGNFGNILAAYYAKEMGLPINKLICASNKNSILTDFIKTGVYDRNRDFYTTISPSMDILISSNLERLLYHMTGENDALINEWFNSLAQNGKYEISDDVKAKISADFYAGCCDDKETKELIKSIFDQYSYTCDTHTAVAVKVYQDYKAQTGDETKTIIASTADPYKFSSSVLEALTETVQEGDEFDIVDKLHEVCKNEVPVSISNLRAIESIYNDIIEKDGMKDYVIEKIVAKK